jgi:hypothetical protein
MIGIRFAGQLGNQMFQYAFGLMLKYKFKQDIFYLFRETSLRHKTVIHKYFTLSDFHFTENIYLQICFYFLSKKTFDEKTDYFSLKFEELNNVLLKGFFQSEFFFKSIKQEIQTNFLIKKKYQDEFKKKYYKLFEENKIISIHVRRGDYKTHGDDSLGGTDLTLPKSYYDSILKSIKIKENYKIVLVSEDPSVIKDFQDYDNIMFSKNNPIVDFQIIQNSDIAIISNSTLAWWAAYLATKNSVTVFAPKYWLGFKVKKEHPVGITSMKNWNWVDAY